MTEEDFDILDARVIALEQDVEDLLKRIAILEERAEPAFGR